MALLSHADIDTLLATVDGWSREDAAIHKRFVCRSFPDAVAFVAALVPGAESADHHPDIVINYTRVTLTYTTHSEGGITHKDFAGAILADEVFAGGPYAKADP